MTVRKGSSFVGRRNSPRGVKVSSSKSPNNQKGLNESQKVVTFEGDYRGKFVKPEEGMKTTPSPKDSTPVEAQTTNAYL